jgi:hypothetical protein
MKQLKSHLPTLGQSPGALACPACERCTGPTRFVGLESIPDSDQADLCTYECCRCEHMQASVVARSNARFEAIVLPR